MFLYRRTTAWLLLACAAVGVAHAQDYPTRPVRIVTVGLAPDK